MTDPTTPDLLLEIVHKMQIKMSGYLAGESNPKEIISDLIYMLDGPEQRAAEAAHTRPQPATASPVTVKPLDIEQAAKNVYLAMIWACNAGGGAPPVWVEGGNSHGQVEARSIACRILSAIQPEAPNARAEALREAARVCAGDEDRPSPISAAKLRRMSVQDQFAHEQRRLAWADADEILALIDTPAPLD